MDTPPCTRQIAAAARCIARTEPALARWQSLKTAVGDAIVAQGGTITHQHGVGKDHARWLAAEKGATGMSAIAAMVREFDPHGVMARGNLLGDFE